MKPVLYDAQESAFLTNGIGILGDVIACRVIEELNGQYELEMQYPSDGVHYEQIALDRLILAKPNALDAPQPFRIYKMAAGLDSVTTINAQHISYDLSGVPVLPFSAQNPAVAMAALASGAATDQPFSFWTDKNDAGTLVVAQPVSIRAALGGDGENSIIGAFGGELAFDRYTLRLYNRRGQDRGVTVRYGKNLIDLNQEKNCAQVYTGILPFTVFDKTVTMLSDKVMHASGSFPVERIMPLDLSAEFEEAPTQEALLQAAQAYMDTHQIGIPAVNLTVQFAQLEQTEEFGQLALLERVTLGDTVSVAFERIGVDAQARCIATDYDVILERYNALTLGDAKATLADTIAGQQKEIARITSPGFLQKSVDRATQLITGNRGGYVVLHATGGSAPDELLVMDQPDIETAVNVWRWNKSGLGYSANGYNGPYSTAITADGHIVADFMDTGNLTANIITSGAIASASGRFVIDLTNNTITIKNNSGENVLTFSPLGGLMVKGGIFATSGEIGGFMLNNGNLTSEGLTLDIANHRITFGSVGTMYDIGGNLVITSIGDVAINPNGSVNLNGPVYLNGNVEVDGALHVSRINVDGSEQTLQWVQVPTSAGGSVYALCRNLG